MAPKRKSSLMGTSILAPSNRIREDVTFGSLPPRSHPLFDRVAIWLLTPSLSSSRLASAYWPVGAAIEGISKV